MIATTSGTDNKFSGNEHASLYTGGIAAILSSVSWPNITTGYYLVND